MTDVPEEFKALFKTLTDMKIKPKADDPAAFNQWVQDMAKGTTTTIKHDPLGATGSTPSSHSQLPKISFFSGAREKKGGETTYHLWRFEVQCLRADGSFTKEQVALAVRRSLRGEAGLVAMRLGPDAFIEDVLRKMESVFGDVDENESIMSEFYNARQKEEEDVTTWSCRLEGILDKAVHMGRISPSQADAMLHDMLWKGLRPNLKDVSHYEKARHGSFDDLRIALRRIEKEYEFDKATSKSVRGTAKQAVASQESESEISNVLKQISTRLEKLEVGEHPRQQQYQRRQYPDRPYQQHYQRQYPDRPYQQPYQRPQRYQDQPQQPYQTVQNQQHQQQQRTYYRGGQAGRSRDQGGRGYGRGSRYNQEQNQFTPIKCNRCGQEGHIARGCRNNVDVDGKALN